MNKFQHLLRWYSLPAKRVWIIFGSEQAFYLTFHLYSYSGKGVMMLSQFPESGRRREELVIGMRSFPAVELVIFYRVFDNYIQIVRILNGRRDIESIFKDPEN
jgi:ParE toxin of type II toxin-antitoxin system, parDE